MKKSDYIFYLEYDGKKLSFDSVNERSYYIEKNKIILPYCWYAERRTPKKKIDGFVLNNKPD